MAKFISSEYETQSVSQTLPEAQRTQGIEFITWIIFNYIEFVFILAFVLVQILTTR